MSGLDNFNELIRDQFSYGGTKYALNKEREATDMLFEIFGRNWLLGTMAKYCYRYGNLVQEKDLLKISCYCYILWLKKGFHIKPDGLTEDVLDTTVDQKSKYFSQFLEIIKLNQFPSLYSEPGWSQEGRMKWVLNTLGEMSVLKWSEIKESDMVKIYHQCFLVWRDKFGHLQTHKTDTGNGVVTTNAST